MIKVMSYTKFCTDPIMKDKLHWMIVFVLFLSSSLCLYSNRGDINHRIVVLLIDNYSNRTVENMEE